MTLQPNGPAPYTTAQAAILAIDAFRDRGLGIPVTADVLIRAGVPETLGNRTIQSLKLLGLLEPDGKPSEQFEDFRRIRGDDEYKSRLQEWLQGVYADVLQYADPSKDSYDRVTEAFRTYEPAGQRRSMATLLLGLWKYAGLSVVASSPSGNGGTPSAPRRKPTKSAPPKPAGQGRGAEDRQDAPPSLPPGLVGLLQQIPRGGTGWTQERHDAFLSAFTAVLDFTVPIRPEGLEDLTDDDLVDAEEVSTS